MPGARGDKAAVTLSDGSIVVVGGETFADQYTTQIAMHTVEQYYPKHDTWVAKAPIPTASDSAFAAQRRTATSCTRSADTRFVPRRTTPTVFPAVTAPRSTTPWTRTRFSWTSPTPTCGCTSSKNHRFRFDFTRATRGGSQSPARASKRERTSPLGGVSTSSQYPVSYLIPVRVEVIRSRSVLFISAHVCFSSTSPVLHRRRRPRRATHHPLPPPPPRAQTPLPATPRVFSSRPTRPTRRRRATRRRRFPRRRRPASARRQRAGGNDSIHRRPTSGTRDASVSFAVRVRSRGTSFSTTTPVCFFSSRASQPSRSPVSDALCTSHHGRDTSPPARSRA